MNTYKVSSTSIGERAHACIIHHIVRAETALDALFMVIDTYCAKVDTVYSSTTTKVDAYSRKSVVFHFTHYSINIRISEA